MKLRNKKTGKVTKLDIHCIAGKNYESLAEINEEWEDYEETKTFWYVRCSGEVYKDELETSTEHVEGHTQIGNYFETKEEAEKAVNRLRGWKRLKDIGYSFDGWNVKTAGSEGDHLLIHLYVKDCTGCEELLDLLFGGEE